jgi:hypothetical protein
MMSNEKVSQLPTVISSTFGDVIYAIQSGTSSQETLQQVFNLMLSNTILNFAGNPNSNVAGVVYQLCWDTTHSTMYICTTTGSALTAIWTMVASGGSSPVPPSSGGTGVSNPTAHTLPVAEGSSNFNFLGPLTNGQLLIGSTGADPVAASIIGTSGITVTNGAGSITLAGTASSIGWNVVTTNQAMVPESGYVANSGSPLTFTLPTTAAVGTALAAINFNTGGFSIAQNASQNIRVGSSVSTTGTGGSVSSSAQGDSIYLVCVVANTSWVTVGGVQGNLTIV